MFFFLSFLFGISLNVSAQNSSSNCAVLLEPISQTYSGACKNGLAHGEGTAHGEDEYKGKFKAGLPNGVGKYIWANGDYYDGHWKNGKKHGRGFYFNAKEGKLTHGLWKEDQLKEEITKEYTVLNAHSVKQVKIHKENLVVIPGTIEILFNINRNKDYFNTLELNSSSGYALKTTNKVTFNEVTFPFTGEIKFVITGKDFIINKSCIVKFEIYEAGPWTVVISE